MVAKHLRKAAEWPPSNENFKNRLHFFFLKFISALTHTHVPTMPRVNYENHTFFLNVNPNDAQVLESMPASTSTFALDNATRQPRRRAESMPWNHQTTILKSHHNSLQNKPFPKALHIPHFIQAGHDGDVEMGWQDCPSHGLGDMGRESYHDYYHTT